MCFKTIHLPMGVASQLPWVPEVFLACGGNFRCRPKSNTASAVGRRREKNVGHFQDLTETGNRARKVYGTQGTSQPFVQNNAWHPTTKICIMYGYLFTHLLRWSWILKNENKRKKFSTTFRCRHDIIIKWQDKTKNWLDIYAFKETK